MTTINNLPASLFVAGASIVYNDGREGHSGVKALILKSNSRCMVVQFEDRADTNTISFSDRAWMDFITIAD